MITSKKPIKWHAEVNYSPDCLEAEARVYLESYARLSCVASPWLKQEKTKKLEKKSGVCLPSLNSIIKPVDQLYHSC